MNVYTKVTDTNKALNVLRVELNQLRREHYEARKYATGQYNSDMSAGFSSQIGFAYQMAAGEESRLETLVSEKEQEIVEKEEELKKKIKSYYSETIWAAQLSGITLAEHLNHESLASQWDEVTQICIDRFGEGTMWELCCK